MISNAHISRNFKYEHINLKNAFAQYFLIFVHRLNAMHKACAFEKIFAQYLSIFVQWSKAVHKACAFKKTFAQYSLFFMQTSVLNLHIE
jgi:hypothetical protein